MLHWKWGWTVGIGASLQKLFGSVVPKGILGISVYCQQSKNTPRAPYVQDEFVYWVYKQWIDPNFGLRLGDIQISLVQGPG